MLKTADLPCAECGLPMWRSPGSLPLGQAMHRACRAKLPKSVRDPRHPCVECGRPAWGSRCRKCRDKAQRIRSDDDHRVQRHQRESAAPGLNSHARSALLKQWRLQCRLCVYCHKLATTIDHVLPLVRGGSNREGNLAPCCKFCNSSKAGLTVIEWRSGKRLPQMTTRLKPKPLEIKAIEGIAIPLFSVCIACGAAHSRRSDFCSIRCQARTAYRLKAGIPILAPVWELRGYTRRAG